MPLSQERRREVENAIRREARGRNPTRIGIDHPSVSTQSNVAGQLSEIIRITVPQDTAYYLPANHPVLLFIKNHESFTSDGMAANDETFSLSQNMVDSPVMSNPDTSQSSGGAEVAASGDADAVLYDAGTQNAFSSVDFSANSVDYSDADTGSTIDVYYLWSEANQIIGRAQAANDTVQEDILGTDVRKLHNANLLNRNQRVTYRTDHVLLPEESLVVYIDTAVDLTNWDASDAYPFFQFPVMPIRTKDVRVSSKASGRHPMRQ